MALLYVTLWRYEMTSKQHVAAQLRSLRRKLAGEDAVAPVGRTRGAHAPDVVILAQTTHALPDNAGYVAAAYLVFFALVLIYVAIMASKLARFERELAELNELADERGSVQRRRPRRPSPRRPPDDERAARARHLAQDRAGRAARARSR